MTATVDPCNCAAVCPHGGRCLGAHDPGRHSYHCDTCSPPDAHGYLIPDGRTLMVVAGCGHAIGPGKAADVTRAIPGHIKACPDAARAREVRDAARKARADGFFEEDEPVEKIEAAFAAGEKYVTAAPKPGAG